MSSVELNEDLKRLVSGFSFMRVFIFPIWVIISQIGGLKTEPPKISRNICTLDRCNKIGCTKNDANESK